MNTTNQQLTTPEQLLAIQEVKTYSQNLLAELVGAIEAPEDEPPNVLVALTDEGPVVQKVPHGGDINDPDTLTTIAYNAGWFNRNAAAGNCRSCHTSG